MERFDIPPAALTGNIAFDNVKEGFGWQAINGSAFIDGLEIPVLEFDGCDAPAGFELDLDNLPPDLQALLSKEDGRTDASNTKTESLSIPSDLQSLAARSRNNTSGGSLGFIGEYERELFAGTPGLAPGVGVSSVSSPGASPLPGDAHPWRVDFNILRRSNTLAAGLSAAVQRSARKIEHEAPVVAAASRGNTPAPAVLARQPSRGFSAPSSGPLAAAALPGRIVALAARALGNSFGAAQGSAAPKTPHGEPPVIGPSDDDIDNMLKDTIKDDDVERFLNPAASAAAVAPEPDYELSPPRGLMNLGNTCFLNAAVQALGHCSPLTAYFLQGLFVADLNEANALGTGCVLTMVYTALLHELFTLRPTTGCSTGSVVDKLFFGGAGDVDLGAVSSERVAAFPPFDFLLAVAQFHPFLASGEMHDAQELLGWLLDALHEDLNRVRQRSSGRSGNKLTVDGALLEERGQERYAAEAWMDHLRFNRSVVVDLFQGQLRSQLRCSECGACSVTFDPFLHLTLPLPAGCDVVHLREAVDLFCREEALDEDNLWGCPCCGRRVRAHKRLSLWKLPQLLMVHLKRFEWLEAEAPGEFYRVRKLNCMVDLPLEGLDMGPQVAADAPQKEPLTYDLIAVVDHLGMRADEGHYTATCLRPDGWFRFDDVAVTPMAGTDGVVNRHNYVLFFERRGAPHEPSSIPQQRASQPHAWPHVINLDWSFLTGSEDF